MKPMFLEILNITTSTPNVMQISVFLIDKAKYTPFDASFISEDYNHLEANGIEIVNSVREANIFVATHPKHLRKFILKNPWKRNFLLWTNEPRISQTNKNSYFPFFIFWKVNVMNVYTGDIFISNVTYQQKRFLSNKEKPFLDANTFSFSSKKIVALMSYYGGGKKSELAIKGYNVDLIQKRSEIALYGAELGFLDVFGRGWPSGISKEDSRSGNWGKRKKDILEKYHFNLCFENTVSPFYVTEKIWDSIENFCLPIYFGGKRSSIYEDFPKNSFIDYNDFNTVPELFDYIQNLTSEEFCERLNKCLEVYNCYCAKPMDYWLQNKKKMLDLIILKCKDIIENSRLP